MALMQNKNDLGFIRLPEFEEWFTRQTRWMKMERFME
jgi:hypothetical protein